MASASEPAGRRRDPSPSATFPLPLTQPTAPAAMGSHPQAPSHPCCVQPPAALTSLGSPTLSRFADLGVPAAVVASLAARGMTHPFPIQSLAIPAFARGS